MLTKFSFNILLNSNRIIFCFLIFLGVFSILRSCSNGATCCCQVVRRTAAFWIDSKRLGSPCNCATGHSVLQPRCRQRRVQVAAHNQTIAAANSTSWSMSNLAVRRAHRTRWLWCDRTRIGGWRGRAARLWRCNNLFVSILYLVLCFFSRFTIYLFIHANIFLIIFYFSIKIGRALQRLHRCAPSRTELACGSDCRLPM